jgi:hypothetical protein
MNSGPPEMTAHDTSTHQMKTMWPKKNHPPEIQNDTEPIDSPRNHTPAAVGVVVYEVSPPPVDAAAQREQ